jgi:glutamate-1-semialdehyde aminotransferase
VSSDVINTLNWYLLLHGVNALRGVAGWVSAVHSKEDIDQTIEAFGATLNGMVADGVIQKA